MRVPHLRCICWASLWFGRYLGDKVFWGANPDPTLLANGMAFIKFVNTKFFCKMRLAAIGIERDHL